MITVRQIQLTVARNFGVDPSEFFSTSRFADVAQPRQIAMMLSREFTNYSLPRIAVHFGRDHTTVLHGIRAAKKRVEEDPALSRKVDSIRQVLRDNFIKDDMDRFFRRMETFWQAEEMAA